MSERPGRPVPAVRPRSAGLLLVLVVALAACTVEPGTTPGHEEPSAVPDEPQATPGFGLLTGPGVSEEPCPERVNPDNGCIHLGALVDTSGPLAPLGRSALEGAQAFWEHVNERGGVTARPGAGIEARFDVDVQRRVADTALDDTRHRRAYDRLEPHVAALALSTGTTTTARTLADYQADDMAAVPLLSGWSGWAFEPLVAQTGASACMQATNGLDWAMAELGGATAVDRLVVVRAPGRSGRDVLQAAQRWADPRGPEDHPRAVFDPLTHDLVVGPDEDTDDVDDAVELIAEVEPEVVLLATRPEETAAIATGTADRDWQGMLVGTGTTFAPSLLDGPAAEVLESRFVRVGSLGPLSHDSRAHREMRRSLGLGDDRDLDADGGRLPDNHAWVAGWVSQYPLFDALREAVLTGDLTRAGIVHALEGITVGYEGALPAMSYADAPDDAAHRRVFVYRPDRDAPMGERLVADAYTGASARGLHLSRPCTDH